jgi:site-specific recombinase XerC
MPEVNSRQLAAVAAVAEYRSFIAAAAHLRMSQPALTLSIKRLEQTLGARLFLRTTRQVTLTSVGREFVAMACTNNRYPSVRPGGPLCRTKATLIYRRTGNLRAVQLLLGHTKRARCDIWCRGRRRLGNSGTN